jgi:Ca2+:H+ antiporter
MDSLREQLLPAVPERPKTGGSDILAMRALVSSDKTWLLLPFAVLGIGAYYLQASPGTVFVLNFLGMIPLARILGDATEEVAAGLRNETLGGLLNATFGNAVEMILTWQTIRGGLITVAKGTLLGSILSNLLLVLGMSFFLGGIGHKQQEFKESGPLVSMSMLLLVCVAFSVPTIVANGGSDQEVILSISRVAAVCVLISYSAFLFYQLFTHRADFEHSLDEAHADSTMRVRASVSLLLLSTLVTAVCSNCVVSCIEGVVTEWGISQAFIGVILLPVIGNACEHVSAIRMAMHDKPILSIGIAVGSSCQIAMFVLPVAVMLGWSLGVPMDLNFEVLNVVIFALAVVIVTVILVDGKSTWIEGFMLQMTYLIVAAAYWFDRSGAL